MAVCLFGLAAIGYEHLAELNQLTTMRIEIPQIQQEISMINEEIDRLNYEFKLIENPRHLLHIAKYAEFADLKFPLEDEVLILQKEIPSKQEIVLAKQSLTFKINPFRLSVILGAH